MIFKPQNWVLVPNKMLTDVDYFYDYISNFICALIQESQDRKNF